MVPALSSFVLPLLAPVPQPDLETCAALALLVSDAVTASTFDRRPPSRWQPSSDSNPRLPRSSLRRWSHSGRGAHNAGSTGRFIRTKRAIPARRPHLAHVAALGARSDRVSDPHAGRSESDIAAIKAGGRDAVR